MAQIAIARRPVRREPTLTLFLFSPLSVPADAEVIDLSSDEWREVPAHVAADAMKGGA